MAGEARSEEVTEYLEQMGARLTRARESCHWTQEDLRDVTGFTKGMISRYENGRVEPGAHNLSILCYAMRVDANVILDITRRGKKR